mmetsp:Transcript_22348/g.75243  ORF Transcript_22348/g.75243 Transcript_22348/m.75243 type:complete len:342 (+) Transcript_22348:33-1058(+)
MSTVKPTAADLARQAQRCLDTFDLPLALKFYERALEAEPDDPELLDATGELLLRLGEPDRARRALQRSASVGPRRNPVTYLLLAQASGGAQAVAYYREGISVLGEREAKMRAEIKKARDGDARAAREAELEGLLQTTCSALCAIAEVYMTDLCDEEDAESQCETCVGRAVSLSAGYPWGDLEPQQSLANLRLSQCRESDARAALDRVVAAVDAASADEDGPLEGLLTVEFRTTTAKLLLEVGRPEEAADILEDLLVESEDAPELRFLAALGAARLGDPAAAEGHLAWFREKRARPDHDPELDEWDPSFAQVVEELQEAAAKGGSISGAYGSGQGANEMETD